MNKRIDQIRFLPFYSNNNGEDYFDGIVCPSQEVLDLIGYQGVQHIDQTLKRLVLGKKELYGENHKLGSGLMRVQTFIDHYSRRILKIVNQPERLPINTNNTKYHFNGHVLRSPNSRLLKDQDYYTIEISSKQKTKSDLAYYIKMMS